MVPRRGTKPPVPAARAAAAPEPDSELARLVEAEVARLRAQAETEGRARGEAVARANQAVAAEALAAATTALREAWNQLAAPLAQKEHDLAGLVTDLSFELARHIVGVSVSANPEGLKTLVAKLIEEAAQERGPRQSIVVRLHPADHALLAETIRIDGAHLLADAAISRGGALVEVVAPDGDPNDKVEWDATIPVRIESIRAALALPGDRPAAGGAAS
jgi:flagellar assembly protein FliH